jgi:hypothetical protein
LKSHFATQQVGHREQPLAPAQQDRRDGDVQLVDQVGTQVLLDRVGAAANAHIHSPGCVARPLQRLVNTACKRDVETLNPEACHVHTFLSVQNQGNAQSKTCSVNRSFTSRAVFAAPASWREKAQKMAL